VPINWIEKLGRSVLRKELWKGDGIFSIVLVNDSEIRNLNTRFLGKEYPTDVIAFPLDDEGDEIWGEIYVSVDRAREQAVDYNVTFQEELARLIIHGILHLLGYKDHAKSDRKKMKQKEDYYIFNFFNSHCSDCFKD
jgi:probable rRNA maturation factor